VKFRVVLVDRAARELVAALGEPVAAGATATPTCRSGIVAAGLIPP
jgi:hypothetical protein